MTKSKNKPRTKSLCKRKLQKRRPFKKKRKGSTPSAKEQKHKAQITNLQFTFQNTQSTPPAKMQLPLNKWTCACEKHSKMLKLSQNFQNLFQKFFRNSPPFQMLQKFSPLLTMHKSRQKCTKCNYKLLKYTMSNTKCYKLEKRQTR